MTDRHPSLQTRDLVTAIQVVEGSFPSNEEEQLDAWQLLIDTGIGSSRAPTPEPLSASSRKD
jgi:hypothetical protein